jgi:hypothetical protein
MLSPEESRRMAKVVNTEAFRKLPFELQQSIRMELMKVDSLDDLPHPIGRIVSQIEGTGTIIKE